MILNKVGIDLMKILKYFTDEEFLEALEHEAQNFSLQDNQDWSIQPTDQSEAQDKVFELINPMTNSYEKYKDILSNVVDTFEKQSKISDNAIESYNSDCSDSDDESTNLFNKKLKKLKPKPVDTKPDTKIPKARLEKTPNYKHMTRRLVLNQPVLSRKYNQSKK